MGFPLTTNYIHSCRTTLVATGPGLGNALVSSTKKGLLASFRPQIHDRGPSENGRHVHTNHSFGRQTSKSQTFQPLKVFMRVMRSWIHSLDHHPGLVFLTIYGY